METAKPKMAENREGKKGPSPLEGGRRFDYNKKPFKNKVIMRVGQGRGGAALAPKENPSEGMGRSHGEHTAALGRLTGEMGVARFKFIGDLKEENRLLLNRNSRILGKSIRRGRNLAHKGGGEERRWRSFRGEELGAQKIV